VIRCVARTSILAQAQSPMGQCAAVSWCLFNDAECDLYLEQNGSARAVAVLPDLKLAPAQHSVEEIE
jgi:hypothetical protein